MKNIYRKAKSVFDQNPSGSSNDAIGAQQPMSTRNGPSTETREPEMADVTRYRYHHGANLGSVFIMEKWLTGSLYVDGAKGSSELAAVEARVKQDGVEKTRERHERHWREYVSDVDLDWLRDVAKCTTVRLPIGYFTLGPRFCEDTPFKKVSGVYETAWNAVGELVRRCHQRGIGVLIDMHGLPGGANAQDHSGTDTKKAEFWGSRNYRNLATRCLCFIAQRTKDLAGVAGIQIINEAEWDAKGMYEWYDQVLAELSKINCNVPIYISDAWNLGKAIDWSGGKNTVRAISSNPVAIDTHLYWCFSDADKKKSPQQITEEARAKLAVLDGKDGNVVDHGAVQVVVGEYSCVLAEDSWAKGGGTSKEELVRHFGNSQSQHHQHRAGGSFFWTYRMDWMPGGEWGFKQMTEQHAITPPASLTLPASDVRDRIQNAQHQQNERKQATVGAHCHYWDSNYPSQYEHWRFEQGWDRGFNDASAFFGMRSRGGFNGADKIGVLDLWVLKRLRESGQSGKFVWEFEQGLRQGIRDFYQCVGV